jgi:hypothetical protein
VLAASGLVAGEGLAGVAVAGLVAAGVVAKDGVPLLAGAVGQLASLLTVGVVLAFLYAAGRTPPSS